MSEQDTTPHVSHLHTPNFRQHLLSMITEVKAHELILATLLFQTPDDRLDRLEALRDDLRSAISTRAELTEAYDTHQPEHVLNTAAWAIKIADIRARPRTAPLAFYTTGSMMEVEMDPEWSLTRFRSERVKREGTRHLYDGSSWGVQAEKEEDVHVGPAGETLEEADE
ncbi:hypothetical protein AC578_6576 [Pseudocercospora eumusae]|uniref:Uncharacterized protein n=1 Tax=Pseudocercospora eumusae TaxID=321146 RepID=A0A139HHV4_9PEZI|nr:hypothetical protein AC578_6576 [Pseudocercospora eumusae]